MVNNCCQLLLIGDCLWSKTLSEGKCPLYRPLWRLLIQDTDGPSSHRYKSQIALCEPNKQDVIRLESFSSSVLRNQRTLRKKGVIGVSAKWTKQSRKIRLDALNTKLAQCPDVYSRKMFSAAPTVVCLRVKRVFSFSKRWERFNLRQQKQTRSENRLPCRTT